MVLRHELTVLVGAVLQLVVVQLDGVVDIVAVADDVQDIVLGVVDAVHTALTWSHGEGRVMDFREPGWFREVGVEAVARGAFFKHGDFGRFRPVDLDVFQLLNVGHHHVGIVGHADDPVRVEQWPGNRTGVVDELRVIKVTLGHRGQETDPDQRLTAEHGFPDHGLLCTGGVDQLVHGFTVEAVDQFFLLGHEVVLLWD
ncbi:hypothetical protein D3C73_1169690 [compost metagenome]